MPSLPVRPPVTHTPPQRPLRRLGGELLGLVGLKIVLLSLLWWLVFAPHPKPDASPEAISLRLAPASHAPTEDRP